MAHVSELASMIPIKLFEKQEIMNVAYVLLTAISETLIEGVKVTKRKNVGMAINAVSKEKLTRQKRYMQKLCRLKMP